MGKLYDRTDIYDLFENEERFEIYRTHWETLLKGKKIETFLDISIGSGNVTLPAGKLGIALSGSDLSEKMLEKCEKKAKTKGLDVQLKYSDFRNLGCWKGEKFDLVGSTGNSLGYVCNTEALSVLEEMDRLINPGGYLYFDMRNWEKIEKEKRKFYTYDPLFDGQTRINVVQAREYLQNGSVSFHILYAFEQEAHIFQTEEFEEHYYPISKEILIDKLEKLGYTEIEIGCFPAQFPMIAFEEIDWYSVIARKKI